MCRRFVLGSWDEPYTKPSFWSFDSIHSESLTTKPLKGKTCFFRCSRSVCGLWALGFSFFLGGEAEQRELLVAGGVTDWAWSEVSEHQEGRRDPLAAGKIP